MATPTNLPSFPGWRPIDADELIVGTDVAVFRGHGAASHPHGNPENGLPARRYSWVGHTIYNGSFNHAAYWIYRRIYTYEGMPKGIEAGAGWFPLPDTEIIREGDRYFRSDGDSSTPASSSIGQSVGEYAHSIGGLHLSWPHRRGADFGSTPKKHVKPPRLPPNPPQLTKPLPLP